jgi:hypothetical protein
MRAQKLKIAGGLIFKGDSSHHYHLADAWMTDELFA